MPAVMLLSLPGLPKKIVPCPEGQNPDDVAAGYGSAIFEYFESEDQAQLSLDRDPTRQLHW